MVIEIPVVKIKTNSGAVVNYAVIGGNYYYFGDDSDCMRDNDNWLRMYTRVYLIDSRGGHLRAMKDCLRHTPERLMECRGVKRIPKPFIYRYVP